MAHIFEVFLYRLYRTLDYLILNVCTRDVQVIYPQTREEMTRRGRSDDELNSFLEIVQLSYLTAREGGWDAVEDWMDVLSGGEKQRVAVRSLNSSFFLCACFATFVS